MSSTWRGEVCPLHEVSIDGRIIDSVWVAPGRPIPVVMTARVALGYASPETVGEVTRVEFVEDLGQVGEPRSSVWVEADLPGVVAGVDELPCGIDLVPTAVEESIPSGTLIMSGRLAAVTVYLPGSGQEPASPTAKLRRVQP